MVLPAWLGRQAKLLDLLTVSDLHSTLVINSRALGM